jgi:hypothetical protein
MNKPYFLLQDDHDKTKYYCLEIPLEVAPITGYWFVGFRSLEAAREAMKLSKQLSNPPHAMDLMHGFHIVEFVDNDFWSKNAGYLRIMNVKG